MPRIACCSACRALPLAALLLAGAPALAQNWTPVATNAPEPVGLCLLLTDGGVMCQAGPHWYRLGPDAAGSYVHGRWTSLAPFPAGYEPDAYASAVLADGRVLVVGGEYNSGNFALANQGAVYDPSVDRWAAVPPPPASGSPNNWQCIGDAPAALLADGRFAVGSKLYQDAAAYDPKAGTWTLLTLTGKDDTLNSEEGWTLLPDGSVFTLEVARAPRAERLLVAAGAATAQWLGAGTTVEDLHTPTTVVGGIQAPGCPLYYPPGEIGPTLLRPDGTVFAVGATGRTGVYTPPATAAGSGTWAAGPAVPAGLNIEDGPGAVLPNGHVLFGASPGDSGTGLSYFEFDGTSLVAVPAPGNAASDAAYYTSLLVLPTGQVLFTDGSTRVEIYTPAAGAPADGWRPTVSTVSTTLKRGESYVISGTRFNGLGSGSAYGDESQNATNYPLVRLTSVATGHVYYARTHDHSTMAVATGATPVMTTFDVPATIETGAATLEVVANGIASSALSVSVAEPAAPPPPATHGGGGGGLTPSDVAGLAALLLWRRRPTAARSGS
jgi:hypothetical protein